MIWEKIVEMEGSLKKKALKKTDHRHEEDENSQILCEEVAGVRSLRPTNNVKKREKEEIGGKKKTRNKMIKYLDSQGLVLFSQSKCHLKGLCCKTNFGIGHLLKMTK